MNSVSPLEADVGGDGLSRGAWIPTARGCEVSHGPSVPCPLSANEKANLRPQHKPPQKPVSLDSQMLSYSKWMSNLVPLVLRTRTPFSAFLSRTILLSKGLPTAIAPTFFPVPIPPGYIHVMPANPSATRRRSVHLSRVLHVMVMALNFWYSGGVFVEDALLQRAPNSLHEVLYRRVRSLLKSDGPALAFQATKAGRRFPELFARLSELSEVLTCNGVSSDPYSKAFTGIEVVKNDEVMPELRPYRDLDPSRIVVSGTGHFDATQHLCDALVLPYREPRVLQCDLSPGVLPPIRDSPSTIARLSHLWDQQGLLYLHREQLDPNTYVRIFNAFKSNDVDRQIGDRRGANSLEARISNFGPSSKLPSGSDISEIHLDPRRETLAICITDRKDFYHQFWSSRRKAIGNSLGPSIPCEMVEDCASYQTFLRENSRKRYDRGKHGDRLGLSDKPLLESSQCFVAFKSILQGDHCGVDIATDAHTSILQEKGLLANSCRLVATTPLRSKTLCEGLVIDDFFSISVERDGTLPKHSEAYRHYEVSQEVYQEFNLFGSPHKDILGIEIGKVIGAHIDARASTRRRGLCTVSSPPSKRLGLSHVSLSVAALSHTSDALHLCLVGGWVSAMGYRRPMYSLFNHAYRLVDTRDFDPGHPKLVPLSRAAANELVLAAVLHPLMCSDLGARFHNRIFATDASSYKGAICSAPVSVELSEVLWKTGRSKGSYTRLLSPHDELLYRLGISEDDNEVVRDQLADSPLRPLAYRFDFIEVYAGAAKVTMAVSSLGLPVGPPIELSHSEEYDLRMSHVISWLTYLLCERLVLAIMVEPPCTTYSILRRPALRSKLVPYGFSPHEEKTSTGNILSHRACQLMCVAGQNRIAGLLETPFTSLLKHLPAYKAVARMPCSRQTRVDSCRFGSPHLKSFRMLSVHLRPKHMDLQCICTQKHLQVQGKYTKPSATYTDALSFAIAQDIVDWVKDERRSLLREHDGKPAAGLESPLVNDAAISLPWSVDTSWTFRRESHINILEESALLRLAQRLLKLKYPTRVVALVDSNVVRGATAKGRSSSLGLSTILRRFNSLCVAAGLYVHTPFCPTRLNVADDPTRDVMLREPSSGLHLEDLSRDVLFDLGTTPKLRRWASNWLRLVLRLCGVDALLWSRRDLFRRCLSVPYFPMRPMDFDSTLGYPGEGPFLLHVSWTLALVFCTWISPLGLPGLLLVGACLSCLRSPCFACLSQSLVVLPFLRSFPIAVAMPISPKTPAERQKSEVRMAQPPLPEGRPVLPVTGSLRDKYFKFFENWAIEEGIDLQGLLENSHQWVEEINAVVCRFGRELFTAGKTYNQYAETINSLTSLKPSLRRQMQGAWDLGFAWNRQEPTQHHVALPSIILVAMISSALMYGWLRFAGCLAIGWGALLRPGEIFGLRRLNLLFPEDSGFSVPYCLVSLLEPKTRYTTARHQSTRLDIPDLLQVAWLSFGKLNANQYIWPYSPQTFRNRFKTILEKLLLPSSHTPQLKCLDPGSMRAGGATWLMQITDNGELVRRRGRWQNMRVMEVYIQEVSSLLYLQRVSQQTRQQVFSLAGVFTAVLERAISLEHASIPHNIWFILFSS